MPRPVRTWGYVRVSGREQATDGTSLDGQQERVVGWTRSLAYPEPQIRIEVESAGEEKIERRVELHRLIKEARPGDVIVVASLSRWSRDIVFGVQSVRQLVRAGVGFYAIYEQIDASTPEGDSNLGLRMWLAEEERKQTKARTVGRVRELRAQGLWAFGALPYGYQRGPRAERKHLHLEPHPEQAPIVVEWHERLARGQSTRDVAEWLRAYPGAPHEATSLVRIVHRRIYLGELLVDGRWIKGLHPPLITLDLWERVQAALQERKFKGRTPGAHNTADCLLRGLVRCALCGRLCGVECAKRGSGRANPSGYDYRYYVCARRRHRRDESKGCEGPYARADVVDAGAVDAILARLDGLRTELLAGAVVHRDPKPDNIAEMRRRLDIRLARAVALATDGVITPAELAAQRQRLDAERAALARREAEQERGERGRDPARRGSVAGALGALRATWNALTWDERREAVRLLAERVELAADGRIVWTWRTPEDLAAEG